MFRISKNMSTTISIALTVIFMAGLIAGAFAMPHFVGSQLENPSGFGRNEIENREKIMIYMIAYLLLAAAASADVILFLLLKNVRGGKVFTSQSIAYVRTISWFCIVIGVLFALLGYWFRFSLIVGFAAVFVGISVRVVKNVIEEATSIKGENDLTI